MIKGFLLSALVLCALLFVGVKLVGSITGGPTVTLVSPEGEKIRLDTEIADTPDLRKKGLMYRESMGDRESMLFVFSREQRLSFWMKNTLIPLDVIYFGPDATFVSYQTMEPCTEDPCPLYPSADLALYALEVNAGLTEEWGVGEGWKLLRE